jgi:hypothetical protein
MQRHSMGVGANSNCYGKLVNCRASSVRLRTDGTFESQAATTSQEEQTYEHNEHDGLQYVQAWRKKVEREEKGTMYINSCSELVPIAASYTTPWACQTAYSQPLRRVSSTLPSITFRHPYTRYAEKCVRLPVSRIDNLLKSDAFRTASAPLFDGSHVDTILDMRAVFPQSEAEPIFLNALPSQRSSILDRTDQESWCPND